MLVCVDVVVAAVVGDDDDHCRLRQMIPSAVCWYHLPIRLDRISFSSDEDEVAEFDAAVLR